MEARASQDGTTGRGFRLLVVLAERVAGAELRDAIAERADGRDVQLMMVAPALTDTRFEHAAGATDDARERAQERLEQTLRDLESAGLSATGHTGDSDLRLAIEDGLREFEADEVLLVAHKDNPPPLEQEGIEEAERTIAPPITELFVTDGAHGGHIDHTEHVDHEPGRAEPGETEGLSRNMAPYSPRDILGIVVAIIGTLALVVLAANCGSDEGFNTTGGFSEDGGGFGDCEMRLLLAGAFGLINIAHVVALMLFQTGPYRGMWRDVFARLSLYGTPLAVLVSALLLD